ncbi:MAG: hypothetical protein WC538_24360 [Thermoanaerobaculia bacterium]|jgi:hypothetical protein
MKKTAKPQGSDLRAEYDFDYSKSKPNRFAAKMKDTIAVVLEPDVAAVFHDSKSVNTLLRSVIAALPREKKSRKSAAKGAA